VSCKCRCFNCHTPDRHKQTNKQTKNLSESLPVKEIVIGQIEKEKHLQACHGEVLKIIIPLIKKHEEKTSFSLNLLN
jgi:hypothetical protein